MKGGKGSSPSELHGWNKIDIVLLHIHINAYLFFMSLIMYLGMFIYRNGNIFTSVAFRFYYTLKTLFHIHLLNKQLKNI